MKISFKINYTEDGDKEELAMQLFNEFLQRSNHHVYETFGPNDMYHLTFLYLEPTED